MFPHGGPRKATTYSPAVAVPSALTGLTTLFGMGRGEPRRYNHLKFLVAGLPFSAVGEPNCLPLTDKHQPRHWRKYLNISEKQHEARNNEPKKNRRTISLWAISTTRLRASPRLHLWPIDVVVSHGPLKKSHLVVGFALICFQRLSLPDVATLPCRWRDNRYTRGPSNPVLSY